MASEAKHTPEEWVCCGCGAPSPELKRVCDCPTGLLYDRNNVGKTIRAKEDPEEPSPLWTTERFESVEAHFYAGGTASPQNGVELFEQLKLTRNALSLSQSRVELMRKALEETVGRIMNAEIDLSTGQTKATVAGRLRDIAADLRKALSTPEQASLPSEVKS